MAGKAPVPDLFLILISIVIAILIGVLLQGIGGHWAAIISLIVLFSLLYTSARTRDWASPVRLPVVGSSMLSEFFLGLTLITSALAISWFLGIVISRTFSDMLGILGALCIFGVLMLVLSASRNWQ